MVKVAATLAAGGAVVAAQLLTNLGLVFAVAGFVLGGWASVMWWQSRDNLRRLNEFLRTTTKDANKILEAHGEPVEPPTDDD